MDNEVIKKMLEFAKSRKHRREMWNFLRDYRKTHFTDYIHFLEEKAFRRRETTFVSKYESFFRKGLSPSLLLHDSVNTVDVGAPFGEKSARTNITYLSGI